MFTRDAHQEITPLILTQWMLLVFCAGIMNVTAFMGLGTFATHVTGFATLFGVHAAALRWGNALAALAVPLFFLLGAIISGLCIDGRIRKNKFPHYDYVMFICSATLFLAAWVGNVLDSNPDHLYVHIKKNFVLLSLICLPSGILNAALSYSSKGTLRITHMTGITTDLGRGIAEVMAAKKSGATNLAKERRQNRLRIYTILCFISGSAFGGFLFQQIDFNVLLFPAAYFLYASLHGRHAKSSS